MRLTLHVTHITDRGPQSKDEHVLADTNTDAIDQVKGKYPAALVRGVIPSVANHEGKYPALTIGEEETPELVAPEPEVKKRGMPKGGWPKKPDQTEQMNLEGEE